jgi:cytochrome c556
MKRSLVLATMLLIGAGAALAQSNAIAERQALMKANGKATGAVVAILKGGPFDLATVQNALKTYVDAANKMPGLFPDDSKTGGDTEALPAVWTNKSDLDARFAKLGSDATAALSAITDEASFKANMPKVLSNCGGCHENYRAKK